MNLDLSRIAKPAVLELPEAEARRRVEDQARAVPQFAGYVESAAPRTIPVFSIRRV